MLYRYVSIGKTGNKSTGTIEAQSADEARQFVSGNGELLVELMEADKRNWFKLEHRPDVSLGVASIFALELATLVQAGAPLRKALEIQSDGKGETCRLAKLAIKQIEAGGSLSSGLRQAGGAAELLAEFVAAGEAGAGLGLMLETGGKFIRARAEAFSRIRSAMSYPLFIVTLSLVAVIIMTIYVAPALAPVVGEGDGAGVLLWLADLGSWIRIHSVEILLGLAGIVGVLLFALRGKRNREKLNAALWSMPLIGSIGKNLDVGQSCEVMAALLESGRSLESALKFAGATSSPRLAKSFAAISERLRDGQVASAAFAAEDILPNEVRRLAMLGESSSAFPQAMRQAGRICHDRAMRQLEKLAASAGPVLVIGMGGMIAGLMLSVLGSLSSIGGGTL
jgi:general secretion pathway protein F